MFSESLLSAEHGLQSQHTTISRKVFLSADSYYTTLSKQYFRQRLERCGHRREFLHTPYTHTILSTERILPQGMGRRGLVWERRMTDVPHRQQIGRPHWQRRCHHPANPFPLDKREPVYF